MPDSGLFKGIDSEIKACTESIQIALRAYESSQAARNSFCQIDREFYKYQQALIEALLAVGSPETRVCLGHLSGRSSLNTTLLSLALMRVYRRVLYCKSFNDIHLNQMKLAGLHAYWLNKLHPIVISAPTRDMGEISDEFEKQLHEINERFGFHLIMSAFEKERGIPKDAYGNPIDTQPYQERFVHALRFRSFTEDSMMLLAESLGREGFQLASI
jgi:hypothetical protein